MSETVRDIVDDWLNKCSFSPLRHTIRMYLGDGSVVDSFDKNYFFELFDSAELSEIWFIDIVEWIGGDLVSSCDLLSGNVKIVLGGKDDND